MPYFSEYVLSLLTIEGAYFGHQKQFPTRDIQSSSSSSRFAVLSAEQSARLMVRNRFALFGLDLAVQILADPRTDEPTSIFFGVGEESLKSERDAPCNTVHCPSLR